MPCGDRLRLSELLVFRAGLGKFSSVPLRATDARKLLRRLLDEGGFVSPARGSHARQEMDNDELDDADVINVLRGGVVREAEWENGSWRYRVETQRMVFVVAFEPEPARLPSADGRLAGLEVVVITGWRVQRR